MKDKQTMNWIPLYVDKWIFGSTRIELEPAERGVFIDLMVLGAKDEGYIRANEVTPYYHCQLAGLLNISKELLESSIAKCIEFGKLEETSKGIYRLCNWNKYQLSDDYKYRVSTGRKQVPGLASPSFSDSSPTNPGPIIDKNRVEEKKEERYTEDFKRFWLAYPNKVGKDAAYKAWGNKKPNIDKCLATLSWQVRSIDWTKADNNGKVGAFIPHPATWINAGRWEDVSPDHKIVNCSVCGAEGILPKGIQGPPTCKKCHQEAIAAQKQGVEHI